MHVCGNQPHIHSRKFMILDKLLTDTFYAKYNQTYCCIESLLCCSHLLFT